METWITLEANRVHVRNRLVNSRSDTTRYGGRHQELPAVYTIGTLHRLFTYTGTAPYTGDDLTQITNNGPPWEYWTSTENWSALVDDTDWGLGVHHPGAYLTVGGFHGVPGVGGPYHNNTGYISPLHIDLLDHDIVYDYQYTLILGDLHGDIRSYATTHAPAPGPCLSFGQDRQHCMPNHLTDHAPPFAGFWRLVHDHNDPQIMCPPALWDAIDVPEVFIRGAYSTQGTQAEIFFAGQDGVFSGDKRLQFTVIPDGAVHTYAVDLSSHPLYTGFISRLRLDPLQGQAPGDQVDLYALTTQSWADVPDGPDSQDAAPAVVLGTVSPNPFNPHTTIQYRLSSPARVDLNILDPAGRLVRTLVTGVEKTRGVHEIAWDGRDSSGGQLTSGAYYIQLRHQGGTETMKMILAR